jgi:hypothetical protein
MNASASAISVAEHVAFANSVLACSMRNELSNDGFVFYPRFFRRAHSHGRGRCVGCAAFDNRDEQDKHAHRAGKSDDRKH